LAQRSEGVEVYIYSSKTSALEGSERSAARAGRNLPPGKTRYSLYRRLVGPQDRSGRAENLASTGIPSPNRPARNQSLQRLKQVSIHPISVFTLFHITSHKQKKTNSQHSISTSSLRHVLPRHLNLASPETAHYWFHISPTSLQQQQQQQQYK
jgi:hypothetical protein